MRSLMQVYSPRSSINSFMNELSAYFSQDFRLTEQCSSIEANGDVRGGELLLKNNLI